MNNLSIIEKLNNLPNSEGVYIMKDMRGEIIYIGKAVSLKNRVRQYFSASKKDIKVTIMVKNIHDFDYIMVKNEKEALLLECNLIKKHRPKYNVLLKDDKHFPYIRIDYNEAYPIFELVRKITPDGAKYFGPYLSAITIREILDILQKNFPLRLCKKKLELNKIYTPCLNYQIGRCAAPCAGKINREEYLAIAEKVENFLNGNYSELKNTLTAQMQELADKLEFEKCTVIRNQIRAIDNMMQKQHAISTTDMSNSNVFGLALDNEDASVAVLTVEEGKMVHIVRFELTYSHESEEQVLSSAVMQYYESADIGVIPNTILLPFDIPDREIIEQYLTEKQGRRIKIKIPKKGENKRLCDLAQNNAYEAINRKLITLKREQERTVGACIELGRILGIPHELHRIECYDISNTGGTDSVGSMVVFIDGKPAYKEYRKFKIKTVSGSDDFESLNEVLTRRLLRTLNNDAKFVNFPDLIVIDGGKGQLSSATDALDSLGLHNLPIISLAKREEEVFVPRESEPVYLERDTNALNLLIRIRDEAHRFAVTFHRNLRQKRTLTSALSDISGIGKARIKILLEKFSSYDEIANSTAQELSAIHGIDRTTAKNIYEFFHKKETKP